jgi:hypothetical protein
MVGRSRRLAIAINAKLTSEFFAAHPLVPTPRLAVSYILGRSAHCANAPPRSFNRLRATHRGAARASLLRTRWSATIPTRGHPTPAWRRDGLATRVLELEQTRLGLGVRRLCLPPVRAHQFGSRSLDPTTRGLGLGAGTLAMISAEGIVRKIACWIGGVRRRGPRCRSRTDIISNRRGRDRLAGRRCCVAMGVS